MTLTTPLTYSMIHELNIAKEFGTVVESNNIYTYVYQTLVSFGRRSIFQVSQYNSMYHVRVTWSGFRDQCTVLAPSAKYVIDMIHWPRSTFHSMYHCQILDDMALFTEFDDQINHVDLVVATPS